MSIGFACTTLFSKAKSGNMFAFVIVFLFGWLEAIAGNTSESAVKFWCSFGPGTSLSLSANHIFNLEEAEIGLVPSALTQVIKNYKMGYHYGMMTIVMIVFTLLFFYLD